MCKREGEGGGEDEAITRCMIKNSSESITFTTA